MQAAVGAVSGHPGRPAPRPRQRAGHLPQRHRARLHERDDGRVAARRRQDAVGLRVQRRRHARGRRGGPSARRVGRGRARHARRHRGRRRARARCTSPIPTRPSTSSHRTGIDALAVAIGTRHGAYKFSRKPDGEVLAMERIKEIHRILPDTHLVMHGSSSVPQELVDIINANGGKHEADVGRAGRGDPDRHPARRPQDQRRHGLPPGDDRRDPQPSCGAPGGVRPARLPEAGPLGDADGDRGAHDRSSGRPGTPGTTSRLGLDAMAERYGREAAAV